ncbi:MAG TPA: RNA 2',3'-cyclic phosphodiesterase [Bacteroidota bacterium]|nr:RNA 2',3'-cyclic phosphodiesterase [Bacteroidota bacterium]
MPSIRTFIALETPPDIRASIDELLTTPKQVNAAVRWETPEKFHVTVKFLGDVDERKLPTIIAKIEQTVSTITGFEIEYGDIGMFPDRDHPRIIWIGCHNPDRMLSRLKKELDSALRPFGFPIEARAFHPHITLARITGEKGKKDLLSILENLTFEPRCATVEEVVVMKSMLKPQGSEYSRLTSVRLSRKT